ncbi:hypothetical protein BST61_g7524 [Cercospora zeina]
MGVMLRPVRRDADDGGNAGSGGLDTHGEIAIGVIVPVVFLLGGLIYFIWRTERRRRTRTGQEPDKTHPSMLQDFLRRKNAFRGSRFLGEVETGQGDHASTEKDHRDRHELGDTSYHHELEDATSPIYDIEKPSAVHPARRDSAMNSPTDVDSPRPLNVPSTQPNHIPTTDSSPPRQSNEARHITNPSAFHHLSSNSNHYHNTTTRHSAVSPPSSYPSSWRASLHPPSFLGNLGGVGSNKRDRRASKVASSRYSQQHQQQLHQEEGFTMMEPHSRRASAISENESFRNSSTIDHHHHHHHQGNNNNENNHDNNNNHNKKRVSDDSDTISPPASNQLSRSPSVVAQRASVAMSSVSAVGDVDEGGGAH